MTDLDELSLKLGTMQSDISHIRDNTERINGKVVEAHEKVINVEQSTKSAHKRIDDIKPHVEDYKRIKQKGLGAVGVIGLIFGLIGSGLAKILSFIAG